MTCSRRLCRWDLMSDLSNQTSLEVFKGSLCQQGHFPSKAENWASAVPFIYHMPKLHFFDRITMCTSASSAHISKRKKRFKKKKGKGKGKPNEKSQMLFFVFSCQNKEPVNRNTVHWDVHRAHSCSLLPTHKCSSQVMLNSSIRSHSRRAASQPVWCSSSSPYK